MRKMRRDRVNRVVTLTGVQYFSSLELKALVAPLSRALKISNEHPRLARVPKGPWAT